MYDTLEERQAFAEEIREEMITHTYGPDFESKVAEIRALGVEDLFPEPKWLKAWDNGGVVDWESIQHNATVGISFDQQALLGRRVVELYRASGEDIFKLDDGTYVVLLAMHCIYARADVKSLLALGILTQEQVDEIFRERKAAHYFISARSSAKRSLLGQKSVLQQELKALKDKLALSTKNLADIDKLDDDALFEIRAEVKETKEQLATTESQMAALDEQISETQVVYGAKF